MSFQFLMHGTLDVRRSRVISRLRDLDASKLYAMGQFGEIFGRDYGHRHILLFFIYLYHTIFQAF